MNLGYLDSMDEVTNIFRVELNAGEKVVYTDKLMQLGDNKDMRIAWDCNLTLTNKRIVVDTQGGVWTFDLEDDIAECSRISGGFWIFKYTYLKVVLKNTIIYGQEMNTLNELHFYFKDNKVAPFEEIMNKVLYA